MCIRDRCNSGRPAHRLLLGLYSILHFRLTELEKFKTLNREEPQRMAELIASISATYHPNWADVQALLNIPLTVDKRWLVTNMANKEAQCLHQEHPNGICNPAGAIPSTEPDWNPNGRSLAFLEHYRKCIQKGLKKGVPKQKRLSVIETFQQKPDEDPSELLENLSDLQKAH